MNRIKLGALETIHVGGEAATGAQPEKARAAVIFHGFGADFTDLAPLADYLGRVDEAARAMQWYFPNGPHSVPIGPHMVGRAWFPLRLAELEQSGVDFTQVSPPGLDKAVDQAFAACETVLRQLKIDWNQLVVGGFSQGAMVALEIALRAPKNLAGVSLLSGSLVDEPRLRELAPKKKGLRFFQSHGEGDSILPFPLAERLEAVLREAGWDGMLLPFRGGHEIPPPVLREWASWLRGGIDQRQR